MSDLISRSQLLKEIEKYKFGAISNDTEREYIKKTILDFINFQPTAYSVDKVAEELDKIKGHYGYFGSEECEYVPYEEAIEIVKQGGVADDVCEWKQTSTARYKTSCGYKLEEHFDTNACYCKQCGKKIKAVEQMYEEDFCYCHNDDTDEQHDCLDYMGCDDCPYYYADLDQESD